MSRRLIWGVVAATFAAAPAPAVAALRAPARARVAAEPITFGEVTCAPRWRPPNPGRETFAVHNQSSQTAVVYLFRADSGRIVGEIDNFRAGTVRRLTATLSPGPYAWGCDLAGHPRHVSEAVPVPKHPVLGGAGPAVVPVLAGQLAGPMRSYRSYVRAEIVRLRASVTSLAGAIAAGDPTAAKSAWLPAHLEWLLIGQDDGAYGAFGELGRQIDGTAAGLLDGVNDPGFTGFHKLELDLFRRHDLSAAAIDTAHLSTPLDRLSRVNLVSTLGTDPGSLAGWTPRPHEILEDALRDSLTGEDDYGSGTGLASVAADVTVTQRLLGELAPLLSPRAPYLVGTARGQLRALAAALQGTRGGDGGWVAPAALSAGGRERINAATGAALETLARVPDLLALGGT